MNEHLESSIFGDHDETVDAHPLDGAGDDDRPVPLTRREAREAQLEAQRSRRGRGSRHGGRGERGVRAEREESSRRVSHRPSIWRRVLVLFLALVVVGGGVAVAYTYLRPVVAGLLESNDYPGPGSGQVEVKIEHGDTGSAIAQTLLDAGVVKSTKAYIEAANANPRSASIQPGIYRLKERMSGAGAVSLLVDPANRITTEVVIREGMWATEVYAELSKQTGTPLADYTAAAKDSAALGLPDAAKGNVEGYLFPASYSFDPGTSAKDQLRQMIAQSVKRLAALGVADNQMERIVTIASLVEAEARQPDDRPKVARVIDNRLAKKMPLQLDSTVNYAVGKHGITTSDADRKSTSPYNTYVVQGLPPGPIGNPGESAIQAAVKPADGPWLFFVTVNPQTGETKFAATYEEHQKYVAEFQAWCQANKGSC